MKRLAVFAVVAFLVVVPLAAGALVASPASSSVKDRAVSQTANLAHARYVCRHGRGHSRAWSCHAVRWLGRELRESKRLLEARRHPSAIALELLGGDRSQHACLSAIVAGESSWRVDATNRYSGAYGIPQALPGSKMASAGPDWRTSARTQIRWMIGYCRSRYGSVCGAWSHRSAYGSY